MVFNNREFTLDRIVRIGITVGLVWGLVWLMDYLSDVLIPFAVALLLAYLINPLVIRVQKRLKNRAGAVFISLLAVAAAAAILVWLITPVLIEEVSHMSRVLSAVVNNSAVTERAAQYLPPDLWQALQDFASRKDVQDFFRTENFWRMAEAIVRKVLPGVWGLIAGTASIVLGVVGLAVIGLYLVFLLIDYQRVSQGWKDLVPPNYREAVTSFVHEFDDAMNRYFRAQAVVASIVGVIFSIGFWLIGLPLAILLGLFLGLLNMVPYLQIIGVIPAVLLALVHALETGTSFWLVLGLTGLVFVAAQLIQDVLLVPKIMGDVTGLSPAVILLSLSIWGKLLGIFGLLIALPMTCLLLAYYQRSLAGSHTEATPPPAAG
jgi:predicted PurR-regulated permease PerM